MSHAPDEPKEPQKFAVPETTQIAQGHDCDVVPDSIDACVAYVEGADMQHRFEEVLRWGCSGFELDMINLCGNDASREPIW